MRRKSCMDKEAANWAVSGVSIEGLKGKKGRNFLGGFQPFNGKILKTLRCALFMAIAIGFVQEASALKRNYSPHTGYLAAIDRERDVEPRDIVPLQPPPPLGPTLSQRIFNDKLVREFRDRYEERFGRTEAEQIYNSPNRFSYFNDLYGFKGTFQEMNEEKRRFGDFVVRRLLEYHIDEYAKNEPKVRPVWEAKERLKEIHVEVASFRFDAQYSIAGNVLDLKVRNPYASLARVRIHMDAGRIGPAPVHEVTYSIGREITRTVYAEAHYDSYDGLLSFIQRKGIWPNLGVSFTEATTTKAEGITPRGSKYIAGLVYIF